MLALRLGLSLSAVLGTAGGSSVTNRLVAGTGTFIFMGDSMSPVVDYKLPSDVGTFIETGQDANFPRAYVNTATVGTFVLAGQIATLTKTSAYTGPGDIVSGAIGFYSPARAYSAAFAAGGGAIMDILDTAGANPATINILSSGFVDLVTLNAWIVAHGSAVVAKLYDQTGNGNHVTTATLAQMPALTTSALNGLPGCTFSSAAGSRLLSANITRAQPFTVAAVAKVTTSSGGIIGSNTDPAGLFPSAANVWAFTSNSPNIRVAATDNVFHAAQVVDQESVSVGTSFISVDGSTPSGVGVGAVGSLGWSTSAISLGRANGGSLGGTIMEAILWPTALSATYSSINSNQHGVNGYGF